MEKFTERKIENFYESIPNFENLSKLKSEMFSKENFDHINSWYRLVKILEPRCSESRIHHFLIGNSLPLENSKVGGGSERINDLEGDFLAENFIRTSKEERINMIKRLEELNKKERDRKKVA